MKRKEVCIGYKLLRVVLLFCVIVLCGCGGRDVETDNGGNSGASHESEKGNDSTEAPITEKEEERNTNKKHIPYIEVSSKILGKSFDKLYFKTIKRGADWYGASDSVEKFKMKYFLDGERVYYCGCVMDGDPEFYGVVGDTIVSYVKDTSAKFYPFRDYFKDAVYYETEPYVIYPQSDTAVLIWKISDGYQIVYGFLEQPYGNYTDLLIEGDILVASDELNQWSTDAVLNTINVSQENITKYSGMNTGYYGGSLSREKGVFEDMDEYSYIYRVEYKEKTVSIYGSLSQSISEDGLYEKSVKLLPLREWIFELSDTVIYTSSGGDAPVQRMRKKDFLETVEQYNGLWLRIKVENGKVVEMNISS